MSNNSTGSGLSLISVVGIVFIVLKLSDVVGWSWFVVLSPFWGELVLVFLFWIVMQICASIKEGREFKKEMDRENESTGNKSGY